MKNEFLVLAFFVLLASTLLAQQPPTQAEKTVIEENGVRCYVLLSAVFTADGRVTAIKALNHPPAEVLKAAIAEAEKIKFKPAIKNGQPVSVRLSWEPRVQLLKPDGGNLLQALSQLFRFLSQENLRSLVTAIEKNAGVSMAEDVWTIARENAGALRLAEKEQKEYRKLKEEALQKLDPALHEKANKASETQAKATNYEPVIFFSLLFEGVEELATEKRERFIRLHNKAVSLGLKPFESQ